MASKAMAIATILLRIFTVLLASGCMVVLILDKATDVDGNKVTFKNVIAYRFVLATVIVAAAYCLLQLPFVIYYACTEKRLIRGDFLPALDFYGDKICADHHIHSTGDVVAFLLATGVSGGFMVTVELKEFLGDLFKEFGADLEETPFESFLNKGYLAAGLLAGAFLCMAILSILSSPQQTSTDSRGFFR